jgi:hypothetical protein
VLLRAVNMHPFKMQVQHIDFQRVSKDKKIHMKVPLHFVNAEKSPGREGAGRRGESRAERARHRLLPRRPAGVRRGGSRQPGGRPLAARARLALPKGVELAIAQDENPVVATVVVPALITEEEEAAAGALSRAEVPTTEQAAARRKARRGRGDKAPRKAATRARARPPRSPRRQGEKKRRSRSVLVVGLGNPGKEYERTRHNAGFWLVERFARERLRAAQGPKFQALVAARTPRRLASLPQSFMNRSGSRCRCSPASSRSSRKRSWWCTTSSTSRPVWRASSRAANRRAQWLARHLAASRLARLLAPSHRRRQAAGRHRGW